MSSSKRVAENGGNCGSKNFKRNSIVMPPTSRNGGFCGALQRSPPPMPSGLARRLANKENYGIGKVKVMLRVSDSPTEESFMSVDKKKREVTLKELPTINTLLAQERGPMVAAPKIFAFDGMFSNEDQQSDICASALSDVIPAVLEGTDGCLIAIGYPNNGQQKTMLGNVKGNNELGAIPCAISWLYKGINERRHKSGSRFSVRVSAIGINAMKTEASSKDLLSAFATDSDDSPGIYFRDDFLGGPTELRAATAERAALFLDAALSARPQSELDPVIIFTLHVYQYCLSRKGGVAGGRSRLHLIDLGGCANRNGGLPLTGIGNILLAILSGQRHPPNKEHPLTVLLKDCLAPLTCHVSILAHVSYNQAYTDTLTTIQLASRIHRMRRRKHRLPMPTDKTFGATTNYQSAAGGSSDGPDPSSSDLSADTVIYMGPSDDATDGEHPPVYLPSLTSGDNRCVMSKVLKGSAAEKLANLQMKKIIQQKPQPIPQARNNFKSVNSTNSSCQQMSAQFIDSRFKEIVGSSNKIMTSVIRNSSTKNTNYLPSKTGSPSKRPQQLQAPPLPIIPSTAASSAHCVGQPSEEHWIDGPRLSRARVAEARHLLREINHVKNCETWIDGPKTSSSQKHDSENQQQQKYQAHSAITLNNGNLLASNSNQLAAHSYGFMDNHKKIMIRQWVENQSSHIYQSSTSEQQQQQQKQLKNHNHHSNHNHYHNQRTPATYHNSNNINKKTADEDGCTGSSHLDIMINPNLHDNSGNRQRDQKSDVVAVAEQKQQQQQLHSSHGSQNSSSAKEDEEDQDSGPSEVPPALPLLTPLGSREISHESVHRMISRHVSRESVATQNTGKSAMMDCALQVCEDEIARTMAEHPLSALSNGDISVVSSLNIGDAFSDCILMGERTSSNQFDQLARLRKMFTSQLAMAEVIPAFRVGDASSVYSEPVFHFHTGSECGANENSGGKATSPRCGSCHQSLNISRTPSQSSLPSLNGIMQIAGMEQYASLRHPDGASDPNLQHNDPIVIVENSSSSEPLYASNNSNSKHSPVSERNESKKSHLPELPIDTSHLPHLQLLHNTTSEAYDSGHDSSTPRTSKHSGISRRAESGYHSVATARDSDELSFTSTSVTKEHLQQQQQQQQQQQHARINIRKKRQDKSLCNWLRNPFTCTHPETEGEISDF